MLQVAVSCCSFLKLATSKLLLCKADRAPGDVEGDAAAQDEPAFTALSEHLLAVVLAKAREGAGSPAAVVMHHLEQLSVMDVASGGC